MSGQLRNADVSVSKRSRQLDGSVANAGAFAEAEQGFDGGASLGASTAAPATLEASKLALVAKKYQGVVLDWATLRSDLEAGAESAQDLVDIGRAHDLNPDIILDIAQNLNAHAEDETYVGQHASLVAQVRATGIAFKDEHDDTEFGGVALTTSSGDFFNINEENGVYSLREYVLTDQWFEPSAKTTTATSPGELAAALERSAIESANRSTAIDFASELGLHFDEAETSVQYAYKDGDGTFTITTPEGALNVSVTGGDVHLDGEVDAVLERMRVPAANDSRSRKSALLRMSEKCSREASYAPGLEHLRASHRYPARTGAPVSRTEATAIHDRIMSTAPDGAFFYADTDGAPWEERRRFAFQDHGNHFIVDVSAEGGVVVTNNAVACEAQTDDAVYGPRRDFFRWALQNAQDSARIVGAETL